jgi:hypothetical protein
MLGFPWSGAGVLPTRRLSRRHPVAASTLRGHSLPAAWRTCLGWGQSEWPSRTVVAGAGGSGWLRAAAAARPPAPVVGRRKRGTPPPHRINMHPGAGDQPILAVPTRRVPALSLRARGERCAQGAAIPRIRPRRHLPPGESGRLSSSRGSFPSPR